MTLKALAGLIGALSVCIGALFAVDGRYFHQAAAADFRAALEQQQTKGIDELIRQQKSDRLETLRIKLSFLLNKSKRSVDEEQEIEFLREQIKALQLELQK